MFEIASDKLAATVIDPVADRERMGGRYCWGGYCCRLRDARGRDLMSGPEFPDVPSAFNGEGLPEVFRFENKQRREFLTFDAGGRGLIVGVGLASMDPADRTSTASVSEPCRWEVHKENASITMQTGQSYGPWAYRLTREVALNGATLTSRTRLENAGGSFTLQWYAHPFFPLTDGLCGVRFAHLTTVGETKGYRMREGGWLEMREDCTWDQAGQFEWLTRAAGSRLCADVRHPLCSHVQMRGDFAVDMMPVWANRHTLSIEPYFTRRLQPGEVHEWSLEYEFVGL